ncbi:SDR family NAD(P)-dependent oxidoreductase [Denitrobaculum tricleocarpae]|uniref:SDR family NAD(P)-dependent oxidoreductase n=1 Tax=Denitrobaculum tricleocarpae TaxID=2591009 RepID=A0A545TTI7_9PROT|nr:SDR family NAD(P)-dependent oxidoreductase [Denitrobaculum tricleocarpae]TQV80532.1 SDR family NAD(P)-dependent oxidoreductase [Denitrobaculum tricleocarpae]
MNETDANWTVITGSTGGIGGEIVKILAARGDDMILVNRSEPKAQTQRSKLIANYPNLKVELITVDLMDTAQIDTAVDKIGAFPGRIDALYNNSGVLTAERVLSAQGFESQFAVNTLAPYQLITGLRRKMARPANETPAIVVNFSSSAVNAQKTLELGNLADPEKVGGIMGTYAQTKLAVTALSAALSDDLKSDNILIRAIDPGATRTAMTTSGNSAMPKPLQWLATFFFSPADKQAAKLVDGADPQAFGSRSGIYIANRKEKKLPKAAADAKMQKELVALLERLLHG